MQDQEHQQKNTINKIKWMWVPFMAACLWKCCFIRITISNGVDDCIVQHNFEQLYEMTHSSQTTSHLFLSFSGWMLVQSFQVNISPCYYNKVLSLLHLRSSPSSFNHENSVFSVTLKIALLSLLDEAESIWKIKIYACLTYE